MSRKRKFSVNGKQVLLLGLVALVITAGYYRWTLETEKYDSFPVNGEAVPVAGEGEVVEATKSAEKGEKQNVTIEKLKEERDRARGELMEEWKKIAQSSEATAEAKKDAAEKIKNTTNYSEKEKSIEILVQSKGYRDCFAQINENGVTVVVGGGELNGSKVAQVKDIIVGETGVEVRNIKISAE